MPSGVSGFWSYSRDDDEAEGGRLLALARLVAAEYRLLTAEALELFVDRDSLEWGEHWRRAIDEALAGITFFIPLITPTYFTRAECRRELLTFANRATALGVRELVLPILYVPVPDLDDNSDDELKRLIASINYERWDTLRLTDVTSADHRSGVHGLARRLADITGIVAARPPAPTPSSGEQLAVVRETVTGAARPQQSGAVAERRPVTDEPGLLDVLTDAEEALPRLNTALDGIASRIEAIGSMAQDATARITQSDAAGKGYAGRLVAARALATNLRGPAADIAEMGSTYAAELSRVDAGFRTLIELAGATEDPAEQEAACEFFLVIRQMTTTAEETIGELANFSNALEASASFSRDLRAPLEQIRDGLHYVVDGQAVMSEWVRLIEESPLDCSSARLTLPPDLTPSDDAAASPQPRATPPD